MSIRASCPVCEATITVGDHLQGKQVECKSCGELFRAEDNEPAEAIRPGREAAPPARRRVVDEDDDEPRGRSRPRHEDDDADDDRPRRRRPRPNEGSSGLLIGLLIGGGVFLAVVVGLILFFLLRHAAPQPQPRPIAVGEQLPGVMLPGNQAAGAEIIQPAGPRVRLDVTDTAIRDLITNGPANTRAVVHSWELAGKMKHLFDVYDIPKAARLTRLELVEPQQMDLSPDGSRLAIFTQSVENGQLLRRVGVWSLPDGKPLVENWTPYPNDPDFAKQRELIWVYLLPADRMLTVSRQGQFDVWDVATQKNVASVPPIAKTLSLSTNLFGHTALSFAVSPDRKTIAIHDKIGYSLFDTATGKSIGKTMPMTDEGTVTNHGGVSSARTASPWQATTTGFRDKESATAPHALVAAGRQAPFAANARRRCQPQRRPGVLGAQPRALVERERSPSPKSTT